MPTFYVIFALYFDKSTQYDVKSKKMTANRIKAVLAEQQKTSKWLADQTGKTPNTISRWCSNKSQPTIDQLRTIAAVLDVDVRVLLIPTK